MAGSRERRGRARPPPPPEVSSVRNGSGDSYSESSGREYSDCKCDGVKHTKVPLRHEDTLVMAAENGGDSLLGLT